MNVFRFSHCASKPSHFANMQERSWALGDETVDELYEYKTLAVYIRTKVANLMLILMKILKNSQERGNDYVRSSQSTSIGVKLTLLLMSSIRNSLLTLSLI